MCVQIFDRLLASIGQDTLDTLFWLAAAECTPSVYSRDRFKAVFYFFMAVFYVCILMCMYVQIQSRYSLDVFFLSYSC